MGKLEVGQDVVIPTTRLMKKIILNGITTISTDFEMMGRRLAEVVLGNHPSHVEVPFRLRYDPSLL